MIKVYIAGAITPTGEGNHAIEFLENVREGIHMATYLIKNGLLPFCPMLDFLYFLVVIPGTLTSDMIYNLSIAWMKECDAILLLPNSKNSRGWKAERRIAKKEGIPIFEYVSDLLMAVRKGEIPCR